MSRLSVMVIGDDGSLDSTVRRALEASGCSVVHPARIRAGGSRPVDVAVVVTTGDVAAVQSVRRTHGTVPVVVVVACGSEELAIAALRAGADDYLRAPVTPEELGASIERVLGHGCDATAGARGGPSLVDGGGLLARIRDYACRVAATDSNVLITGETGTGKELIAQLIHAHSPRRERPFVAINCAAIPESLVESELFGYERGAFTGAGATKEGQLRLAHGGSVFFDEIGDMSAYAQAKILRAVESGETQRLGGTRAVPIDVRVIAATNQDLEALIAEGRFRKDLYFRFNVARIHLPPLRDRVEDIPRLVHHFVGEMNLRFGRHVEGLTDEAMDVLLRHDWPGNVRELRNVVEAAFFGQLARQITLLDLPERLRARLIGTAGLPQDERIRLLEALFASNWNKSRAAQRLRWSRMTLYRKMAKYHVVR